MFPRRISITNSYSYFLFGARATGKTTLLRQLYSEKDTYFLDLLNLEIETELRKDPEKLSRIIDGLPGHYTRIVVDEVQKIPRLLDVVHRKIEERKRQNTPLQFVLTGSSARKLKRGAANLLSGRAFLYHLFPLTHRELGDTFSLQAALEVGTLPGMVELSDKTDKHRYLEAYSRTYLKEEVWSEQIVRKLEPFGNFLEVAAQCNGTILNYSKIARDIGVDTKTIQSYYQILADTLVGFSLPAYRPSIRKRQLSNPKFYFFDTGVKRALDNTLTVHLAPQTYAFGCAFEHFLLLEMYRLNEYQKLNYRFSYVKTHDGAEVDCIIERPGRPTALVEIKSTSKVDSSAVKHLELLRSEFDPCETYCLSLDNTPQKFASTLALPWQQGLRELGF